MRTSLAALAAVGLAVAAASCRRGEPDRQSADDSAQPASRGTPTAAAPSGGPPAGPTGTITGRVVLTGTPPEMPMLQRGSDPFCGRKEMRAEAVLVGEGGALANALARIAPGAVPGWVPSEPAVVDQVDCMYRPRVQGAVRGQMLVVKNSDPVAHTVEARRMPWGERRDGETLFNRAQPAGGEELRGVIRDADIHKLKCHMHGWMQAYVVVGDNPYFATSGADGRFRIDRAPVGRYQLQIWHEHYGVKTADVTVEAGKTAEVNVTYDADKDRLGP